MAARNHGDLLTRRGDWCGSPPFHRGGGLNLRPPRCNPSRLTPKTRLRLQEIINRIAAAEPVSLADRIYVQKFADRDPTVWSWLRRARRAQVQGTPREGLDRFLAQMDLGEVGPEGAFDPRRDDLGEWFSGAPGWLRRS
jgi:hypothetical protein